jgi:hypothetical protein
MSDLCRLADSGYSREEPYAGKPHVRICEGESRMAELLDHSPALRGRLLPTCLENRVRDTSCS